MFKWKIKRRHMERKWKTGKEEEKAGKSKCKKRQNSAKKGEMQGKRVTLNIEALQGGMEYRSNDRPCITYIHICLHMDLEQ